MRNTVILGAALAASFLAFNCGSDAVTCDESGTCPPTSGEGGPTDGQAGDGPVTPLGCDPMADPKDAPKCVVDSYGVFVDAANGQDSNAGTMASPVKTIMGALGKLSGKNRVYVCAGTYAEHVKLTTAVSIYGGFTCGTWAYDGSAASLPKLMPTDAGYALEIDDAGDLVIADLDIETIDATSPSGSSIAAFVSGGAGKITIRRATLTAGKGAAGSDAVGLSPFMPRNAPDGADGASGGADTPNPACNKSIGGAGGNNNAGMANGKPGAVSSPTPYPTANDTGVGGVAGEACGQTGPRNGSYGVAGAIGAGAPSLGSLTATGWVPADGTDGGAGGDAQGGGGGAQTAAGNGGTGGAGGPGGCGGAGGPKGTGGGASIALLIYQAAVSVEQSSLVAHDAGRGGNGAQGQTAQLGNLDVATGSPAAKACGGGLGGTGGSGGGGGGGAGGISVGIFYKGAAPTIDGTPSVDADSLQTVTLGALGSAGAGGMGGTAADTDTPSRAGAGGTAGALGLAKAVLAAP